MYIRQGIYKVFGNESLNNTERTNLTMKQCTCGHSEKDHNGKCTMYNCTCSKFTLSDSDYIDLDEDDAEGHTLNK